MTLKSTCTRAKLLQTMIYLLLTTTKSNVFRYLLVATHSLTWPPALPIHLLHFSMWLFRLSCSQLVVWKSYKNELLDLCVSTVSQIEFKPSLQKHLNQLDD